MSASAAPTGPPGIARVKEIVVVHSAKGGVGKSTVSTNLAVTFARLGLNVALLDADIHGPSIALMLGSSERPAASPDGTMALPITRHGVAYLSLANIAADDAPIIWRGPMVASALQQMLGQVDWGERDLLLIDLPPGTGDTLLGLGQSLTLSGVVAVTTPQEMSLADTRRGLAAFGQLQVPIFGLIENMAGFVCDGCGERALPFGEGGGAEAARKLGIPFLGRLPLDPAIGVGGDRGRPIAAETDSPSARAFEGIARAVLAQIGVHGSTAGTTELTWERLAPGEFRAEPPGPLPPAGSPGGVRTLWQASDDTLGILWNDGRSTFHGAYELRTACPCAACHEEWTGERMASLDQVPADVRPIVIRTVGRYAIQPVWSDGHRTGIFAFPDLARGVGAVERR
ncbi:MAG: P-loop NTPase [bacterium]